MSKNYASSNKTQKNTAGHSTLSSSVTYKYNSSTSTSITTSSQNTSSSKVNNGYQPKYNYALDANKVRPTVNKVTTEAITKPTLASSYTPVYKQTIKSFNSPTTTITSINKPPPNPSTSTNNFSMFNEVFISKPKQPITKAPTKSQGLFYSFDEKQATPKQSFIVPAIVTASAFNNRPAPKPTSSDRPIPPPSMLVDRPVKKSIFSNPFSSNRKRGYALILNHYKYENDYQSKREGTQYDVNQLEIIFDYYKIESHVKTDLKLNQIRTEVNILKYKDFSKYECFIIVILTHGNRNEILCANDKSYNFIQVIEDPLLIENKSLLNKPKIFVIQACRGGEEMPVIETDSVQLVRRQSTVAKRNIFKCNATYEGYVSFRHTRLGTIFIQTFCRKLKEMGKDATIYDVMMKVIDEVSNDSEIPQVPTVQSSMTNSFCFGSLLK